MLVQGRGQSREEKNVAGIGDDRQEIRPENRLELPVKLRQQNQGAQPRIALDPEDAVFDDLLGIPIVLRFDFIEQRQQVAQGLCPELRQFHAQRGEIRLRHRAPGPVGVDTR